MISRLILAFYLGLSPAFAHAHINECEAELKTKIGYVPHLLVEASGPGIMPVGISFGGYKIIALDPDLGVELGHMDCQIYDDGRVVRVDLIEIYDRSNQRKGLGSYLYARMLKDNPNVQTIYVTLGLDNLTAIKHRLIEIQEAHSPNFDLPITQEDCVKAFEATASYKMKARFGFTKVSGWCMPEANLFSFFVQREPPH